MGIVHAATLARLLGCFSWPAPLPTDGTLVSPPLLRILGTGTRIAGGSSRVKIHSGSVSMRAANRPATMATTPSIVTIPCATARLTSPESKYRRVPSADGPGTMTSRAGTVTEGHDGRHGQYV